MKKITGLKIAATEELENGLLIELEDGTKLVGNIFVIEGDGEVAEEKAPVKEAAKAPVKEAAKPTPPTYDEVMEMDLDELKDCIDDLDLDIKTKGKDEDDLKEEIIEELELEKPAKKEKETKKAVKKAEVDVDDLEWSDIDGMDEDELSDLIKQEKYDIDLEDYDDDLPGLKKAVAKEIGIKPPKK